jgi:hypothetical protein
MPRSLCMVWRTSYRVSEAWAQAVHGLCDAFLGLVLVAGLGAQ